MGPEIASLQDEIDRKSAERRTAGRGSGRIEELDEELDGLYHRLREARAAKRHGTRDEIVKSARVERELEKIIKRAPTG